MFMSCRFCRSNMSSSYVLFYMLSSYIHTSSLSKFIQAIVVLNFPVKMEEVVQHYQLIQEHNGQPIDVSVHQASMVKIVIHVIQNLKSDYSIYTLLFSIILGISSCANMSCPVFQICSEQPTGPECMCPINKVGNMCQYGTEEKRNNEEAFSTFLSFQNIPVNQLRIVTMVELVLRRKQILQLDNVSVLIITQENDVKNEKIQILVHIILVKHEVSVFYPSPIIVIHVNVMNNLWVNIVNEVSHNSL